MNIKDFKKRLMAYSTEELNVIAARNQKAGLETKSDPQMWAASCRMAKVIREEIEAREEVAAFARHRLGYERRSYAAA